MSFEVTVTPTVYDVEVAVNPSVQPFDVEVTVGNVPDLDLTTNGDSGASTFDPLTGELNIPNYTLDGLGGVPESRTLTINGTTQDLSANRTFTIPTHDAVTIGTANGLTLSGQVLSLGLASSGANGALSSTDWTTFNNKQNAIGYTPENVANKAINFTSPDDTKYPTTLAVSTALAGKQDTLTNPITGTGVAGQVSFWTGTGTQSGDNGLFWNNSTKNLRINQATDAGFRLDVNGTARIENGLTLGNTTDSVIYARSLVSSSYNIFTLTANSANTGIMLDMRPSGSANVLGSVYLRDSSTSASGSNTVIIGRGTATLPSTGVTYIGAIVNGQIFGNSLNLGFLVSNTSLGRFEAMRMFNSGNTLFQSGGTYTDNASALVTINSTTKGFLLPRMTGAQAEAISSPAEALLVYSTDGTGTTITSKGWWGFNGSTWEQLN